MGNKLPSTSPELISELREEVLKAFHKPAWIALAKLYGDRPDEIRVLFDFFLSDDLKVARTSAEIIRYIFDADPSIALPYIDRLIERLHSPAHDGIKRGIFRIFQRSTFTDDQAGKVVDLSFDYLQNRENPIAVRVFAMTTIYNISKDFPELYDELCNVITPNLDQESTGFQNRAGKILAKTWK